MVSTEVRDAIRAALDAAWREFGAELDLSDPLGRQLLANQLVHRGITAGGGLSAPIAANIDETDGVQERLEAHAAQLDALWREIRSLRSDTHG
jgi:hypothetical protein